MSHKETSAAIATLASRAMRDPESLTRDEIQSLGASALAQREEDFDENDEVIVPDLDTVETLPTPTPTPTPMFIPDLPAEERTDGEDTQPVEPDILDGVEHISPKILTDAFVTQMRGVVIPTRKTAVRMTEFALDYLKSVARSRRSQ